MKSITLIVSTVVVAFILTAFTYSSWNGQPTINHSCQATIEIEPPTFFYSLSSGSNNTISKERMHTARTISDLVPDYSYQENLENNIMSVRDVKIGIEEEDVQLVKISTEKGIGNSLSKEQMNLLKSADYSTNFNLEGFYTHNDLIKDESKDRYFNYYMTVVPEQQASYKSGDKAFIDFLTTKCQPTIDEVQRGNLKSGSISFIVNKAGTISKIGINATCGYPSVDKRMVELINNLPEAWNAAADGQGEKLDQILVFSYGQGGC